MDSVSTAGSTEQSPRETLLAWTVERLRDRPAVQVLSREPHNAIPRDCVSGEPLERFEDVAKITPNIAVVKLPTRKPCRVSNSPSQQTPTRAERVDGLTSTKAGHLTEQVVGRPRPRLELL